MDITEATAQLEKLVKSDSTVRVGWNLADGKHDMSRPMPAADALGLVGIMHDMASEYGHDVSFTLERYEV